MLESDLLATDHIDGLDGLENGQDGDAIMQGDGVKRELNEANIDDPVFYSFPSRTFTNVRNYIFYIVNKIRTLKVDPADY